MRTSSEPSEKASAGRCARGAAARAVVGVVCALAFFCACNALITLVYEPYGSRSDVSWSEYAKMDDMDTVVVGTSLAQHAIDPDIVDGIAGTTTFNLATPSQSLEDSFIGIQTAYEDHAVKRAVLGLSRTSLTTSGAPNAVSPYLRLRSKVVSPEQTFSAVNQMLWRYGANATETSINWIFPWISNHVKPSLSNFAETAQAKLSHADLIEACEHYDPGWKYVDHGHGTRGSKLNYDSSSASPLADDEEGEGAVGADAGDGSADAAVAIDPDRARTLCDIFSYCEDHGIELTVVSLPLPLFNVIDPQAGYFELAGQIEAICAEAGLAHYDFNLASSDLFEVKPSYFYDSTHFNLKGARAFSKSFGKFIAALDAGEDVDGLFVGQDELLASADYISVVALSDAVDAQGMHVHARAIAGPAVQAEYQFMVRSADTGEWELVRDWSQDADCTVMPESRGLVRVRVNARQVGSQEDYERYHEIEDLW